MPAFESMAARVGVAMPSWRECVAKHLTRPMIEADYARSRTAGVKSTPAFFVGDQLVAGVESYAFFRQVIEGQLGKSKRPVTRP
jgi:predicted DsbA family dithiol-disulfide isomerase